MLEGEVIVERPQCGDVDWPFQADLLSVAGCAK
jgi:hypothetical protein